MLYIKLMIARYLLCFLTERLDSLQGSESLLTQTLSILETGKSQLISAFTSEANSFSGSRLCRTEDDPLLS